MSADTEEARLSYQHFRGVVLTAIGLDQNRKRSIGFSHKRTVLIVSKAV